MSYGDFCFAEPSLVGLRPEPQSTLRLGHSATINYRGRF